jgi:small subunit ribosomal protein S6
MVIFDVDLEEGDIRQHVDRVLDLVKSRGGKPGSVNHWGRRTFAYEIKHRSEGYYVLLEATAEPATIAEVERVLALEDAVLRHKVIRQPDQVAGRARPSSSRRGAPSSSGSRGSRGGTAAPAASAAAPAAAAPVAAPAEAEAEAPASPVAADAADHAGASEGEAPSDPQTASN